MPHPAQEEVRLDDVTEVEHAAARIERREKAIARAPAQVQAVVQALQCLRAIKQLCAAMIVTEVDVLSHGSSAQRSGWAAPA